MLNPSSLVHPLTDPSLAAELDQLFEIAAISETSSRLPARESALNRASPITVDRMESGQLKNRQHLATSAQTRKHAGNTGKIASNDTRCWPQHVPMRATLR